MLAWIAFGWLAVNYAFAAQLVYTAARRNRSSRRNAIAAAISWPRALVSARLL